LIRYVETAERLHGGGDEFLAEVRSTTSPPTTTTRCPGGSDRKALERVAVEVGNTDGDPLGDQTLDDRCPMPPAAPVTRAPRPP